MNVYGASLPIYEDDPDDNFVVYGGVTDMTYSDGSKAGGFISLPRFVRDLSGVGDVIFVSFAADEFRTVTSEEVKMPREIAQTVLDIATHSLDFGSGFLDDEQVEALRSLAVALDVDPWLVTPSNHKPKYCPEHVIVALEKPQWAIDNGDRTWLQGICDTCGLQLWHQSDGSVTGLAGDNFVEVELPESP